MGFPSERAVSVILRREIKRKILSGTKRKISSKVLLYSMQRVSTGRRKWCGRNHRKETQKPQQKNKQNREKVDKEIKPKTDREGKQVKEEYLNYS